MTAGEYKIGIGGVALLASVLGIGGSEFVGPQRAEVPSRSEVLAEFHAKDAGMELAYLRLTGGFWQLWVGSVQGGAPRQITTSDSDKRYPRWSSDGGAIFYRNGNHEPYAFRLHERREQAILPGRGLINRVVSAADPAHVVYARFRSNVLDMSDLWTARLDGGGARILTREVGLQYDPAISPDGKTIAFISGHGYGTHELCLCDADGGDIRPLTKNTALELSPTWSPDGKRIAYTSDTTGDFEIWIMDIASRESRRLTENPALDGSPSWSPDGRRIAFTSSRSGKLQVWVLNIEDGETRQVTFGEPARDPDWRRSAP